MKTSELQSAVEQLQALARLVEQSVNELLQYSELRPAPVAGNYCEWHATNPAAGTARVRALGLLHTFEDDLHLILSWHDPGNDQVHSFRAHDVYEIVDRRGHTQLASIEDARRAVSEYVSGCLRSLADVPDRLEGECLVIPDTNVLIDYPTLEEYHLGLPKATVVFTPIVIRELEDHKRRRPKPRDTHDRTRWTHARAAIRRIKECGDAGEILVGVPISGKVSVMAVATEPRQETMPAYASSQLAIPEPYPPAPKREGLPGWLDLNVPDDRFIASALEARREYPKARIVVVSADFNVLNKARAARLAAFDAEEFFEDG